MLQMPAHAELALRNVRVFYLWINRGEHKKRPKRASVHAHVMFTVLFATVDTLTRLHLAREPRFGAVVPGRSFMFATLVM
jgi:hypothetical protein